MSKPSRKPASGRAVQALIQQQADAERFRLRPLAAHVGFICQHWNRPELLYSVKGW